MTDPPEQVDPDAIEDLELDDADVTANEVTGGLVAPPAGPVPIPYPNLHS